MNSPAAAELTGERPKPRFYVLRVLSCERDFTPTHVSVVGGPYATLIDAWRGMALHRSEFESEMFVAGEMDSTVEAEIRWRSIPS